MQVPLNDSRDYLDFESAYPKNNLPKHRRGPAPQPPRPHPPKIVLPALTDEQRRRMVFNREQAKAMKNMRPKKANIR